MTVSTAPDFTKMSGIEIGRHVQAEVDATFERIAADVAEARNTAVRAQEALAQHDQRTAEISRQIGQLDAEIEAARRERGEQGFSGGAALPQIEKRIRSLRDDRERLEDQANAAKTVRLRLERDALLAELEAARQYQVRFNEVAQASNRDAEVAKAEYSVKYAISDLLNRRNPYGAADARRKHLEAHKAQHPELYPEAENG